MTATVVIDCFPDSVERYGADHAIVAVDVVRATTTATTAAAAGWRCFLVPSVPAARDLATRLPGALLVGEQRGFRPPGFDLNNSPTELLARADHHHPLIMLSSSGTPLCCEAAKRHVLHLACFRNHSATVRALVGRHRHVAVIGAGSRGEFREEDQMCCAWVADGLVEQGHVAVDDRTTAIIERWRHAPADAWLDGKSAAYLRRSGQTDDLEFVVDHVADLDVAFTLGLGGEVRRAPIHGGAPDDDLLESAMTPCLASSRWS